MATLDVGWLWANRQTDALCRAAGVYIPNAVATRDLRPASATRARRWSEPGGEAAAAAVGVRLERVGALLHHVDGGVGRRRGRQRGQRGAGRGGGGAPHLPKRRAAALQYRARCLHLGRAARASIAAQRRRHLRQRRRRLRADHVPRACHMQHEAGVTRGAAGREQGAARARPESRLPHTAPSRRSAGATSMGSVGSSGVHPAAVGAPEPNGIERPLHIPLIIIQPVNKQLTSKGKF